MNTIHPILQQLETLGFLSPEQVAAIMQEAQRTGVDPTRIISDKHFVNEEQLVKVQASVMGVPYMDLREQEIDAQVLNTISQDIARNYRVVPWKQDGNVISVGMIDPHDYKAIEALDFLAHNDKVRFQYSLISQSSLQAVLQQYDSLSNEVAEVLEDQIDRVSDSLDESIIGMEEDGQEAVKNAPVSKTVAVILRYAVEGSASDVHIEPTDLGTRVRYRVDGILHQSLLLPKTMHAALVARIKVLANMKLDETRLPQDGRFRMHIDGRDVDFRVSTMPLVGQEKVVMRILDKESGIHNLQELGYADHNLELIEQHLKKPHGMILITGPTGSGKSTTLYAMLQMLNNEERNIITLEDPVEYNIPGIAQSQVHPEIGLTFARGLRSVLRQDPDIVMVGEIRDNETAELAIHAALTGHMLLSTLHTNDALGAIPRLIDMKIQQFLISSALNLVIAQRLVRRICTECTQEVMLPPAIAKTAIEQLQKIPEGFMPPDIAAMIQQSPQKPLTVYKGQGCHRCEDTGYKGRVAIAEVIEASEQLAEIIAEGKINHIETVQKELRRQGMIPLQQDGLIKALRGSTTIEEVLTVSEE